MTNTTIGILAHVDAGKTTLSESILYQTGAIRSRGRVDHGDAFLDTDAVEKKRGITIYSKLARFERKGRPFTILDTPGHADFSPEMERTLQVLDAAVLVVSATDLAAQNGPDPQVMTLWRLLAHYEVPTFLFVNKMDQFRVDGRTEQDRRERLFRLMRKSLGEGLVIFDERQLCEENEEAVAVCEEELTERILEGGKVTDDDAARLVAGRQVFPVYYGSALHGEGTENLLEGLCRYAQPKADADARAPFGAVVYKITREGNTRLTWMKITGGTLSVRDSVRQVVPPAAPAVRMHTAFSGRRTEGMSAQDGTDSPAEDADPAQEGLPDPEEFERQEIEEKISELRLYSGERYTAVSSAAAGEIVTAAGLSCTRAGDGLGAMETRREELLTPIMTSRVTAEDAYGRPVDAVALMKALRALEEQEPMLQPSQDEETGELQVRIMGQVQTEILSGQLWDRWGMRAQFSPGTIVYQETIRRPVEGAGHFEPLRHYAEVHLLLEPGEPGSGLIFEDHCPPDTLERNWRNLILSQLRGKVHKGVLTGSAITDMKISLIGGRASRRHTSGGDFRKAACAAVRQGLMMAENILLEPVLAFRLEVPAGQTGRAMNDISQMSGHVKPAELTQESAILEGTVPASELGDYAQTVAGYTGGRGRLSVSLKGYEPCHNAREVMDRRAYDPDTDRRNPTWSIFCSHGAGTVVPWDRVREYMHVETGLRVPEFSGPFLTDDYYTFTGTHEELFEIDRGTEEILPAGSPLQDGGRTAAKGPAAGSGTADHSARRKDPRDFRERQRAYYAGEEELQRIFERTYGPVKRNLRHPDNERYESPDQTGTAPERAPGQKKAAAEAGGGSEGEVSGASGRPGRKSRKVPQEEYLLVDGYNIIFAWEDLKELAADDIGAARDSLLDILSDYAGYSGLTIIAVFDAYKVAGGKGQVLRWHNIDVVYTKEAETADLYIERTAHRLTRQHRVTVATGDYVEQVIIFGAGAMRMSPRGLLEAILQARQDLRERYL